MSVSPIVLAATSPTASSGSVFKELVLIFEFIAGECAKFGWNRVGLFFGLTLVLQFLGVWAVARFIARDRGTLWNSLRYYGWGFILMIAGLLAVFLMIVADWWMLILVLIPAAVIAAFLIPMRVFEIGFFRVFGFLIVMSILSAILSWAVELGVAGREGMPWTAFSKKPEEDQRRIMKEWYAHADERARQEKHEAMKAAPTMANVKEMFTQLQSERAALDPNDKIAVERYNARVAEYNVLKAKVSPVVPSGPQQASR